MIERIEGLPRNVLGFRASGRVTEHDYEWVIIPAVKRASRRRAEIRLMYQLAPDFEGFDPRASWSDPRMRLTGRTHWARVALVTDLAWLRRAVSSTCAGCGLVPPSRNLLLSIGGKSASLVLPA